MIVCSCYAVTESTIRKLVREGASTPGEIGLACAAGTCCGGCRPTLVQILEAERPENKEPRPRLATAS